MPVFHLCRAALAALLVLACAPLGLTQCPAQALFASDGAAADDFGSAVGVSGDRVITGALFHDGIGFDSGQAYIFERTGGTWSQTALLVASDETAKDRFGFTVGISETVAAVGARYNDDVGYGSGSAYIFEDLGSGWLETAKVRASDESANDFFGNSVAVGQGRVLVGAMHADVAGFPTGAGYVFHKIGGVWTEAQKLVASDGATDDAFGCAVAIAADRVIIGARLDDDLGADAGSAYVFEEVGGQWVQAAKLLPSDGKPGDLFGVGVDIAGDVAVVGAVLHDDALPNTGATYVFERRDGQWTQTAKLRPKVLQAGDGLGFTVAVDGDTIVTGSRTSDVVAKDAGAAFVFRKDGAAWRETAMLTRSGAAQGERQGFIAMDGGRAVAGAEHGLNSVSVSTGLVQVYDHVKGLGVHGDACTGSGGFTPEMRAVGCPVAGGTITVRVIGGQGGAPLFLFLGIQPATLPLGGACHLLVQPPFGPFGPIALTGSAPGKGTASLPFVIPAGIPAGTAWLQGFIADPAGVPGYTVTNAVSVTLP